MRRHRDNKLDNRAAAQRSYDPHLATAGSERNETVSAREPSLPTRKLEASKLWANHRPCISSSFETLTTGWWTAGRAGGIEEESQRGLF